MSRLRDFHVAFYFIILICDVVVLAASCFTNLSPKQFTNCAMIAPNYALHWSVNASVVIFGVDVDIPSNSNSWIGLGISQMGGMFGADIWILLKNATSGSYYIQDSFATTTVTPTVDDQQDAILLTPPRPSDTNTVFTFMRPTKTCDSMDYEIVSAQQQHIIFAYGQSTTNIGYHGPNNRGNAVVTLYPAPANSTVGIQKAKALKAVKQLAATSNLNTVSIHYLCVHFELPSDQKYHVVQYEGIITTNVVHHMIMYGCTGKPSSFGDLYECSSMTAACSQFTLAWVPGAGTILFPAQAGFAIGTGVNAIRYFALQIHYNNQDNLSNLIDSSGMKIYYTTVLRPNDIGILTLGNEEIKIPANSPNFTSTTWNVCPASCTKQFSQNLTVISNGFHMHTLGFNITTKQIRNGQEIATLGDRNYYNFFYQGASPPTDPNAVIMPGDILLTRCTYLPSSRNYTTRFGESTTNEMCFNFVTYYPAMPNVAVCLGSSQQQMAACSTQANLESLTGGSSLNVTAIANAMAKGWIVFPVMPNYQPFIPPICKRSLLVQPGSAGQNVFHFLSFVVFPLFL